MLTEEFDEINSIKDLQKDAKNIGKYFDAIVRLKPGDTEVLNQLRQALQALPPAEELSQMADELRNQGKSLLDRACQLRAAGFKRWETAFIRQARETGKSVREFTRGWRVGPLELQVKPEEALARFLYNGEILVKWQPVNNADDLMEMENRAILMLDNLTLPVELLVNVIWEAYQEAGRRNQYGNHALVPIAELYREVRINLIRHSLAGKAPQKKLDQYLDFPKWAFLYNLDLLRALGAIVPLDKRLVWQTGSIAEVSKGKGFILNGLEAMNEYKVMVYVSAASEVTLL